MKRAIDAAPGGSWPETEAIGTVTLDYESRRRRRIRLVCDDREPVLLDLAAAVALRDGDGLRIEGGGWIAVTAADEDLVEIRAETARSLHRIAWHLGNRHCPAEIRADRIFMRRDHVIEAMLEGLGAKLTPARRPFDPEGGAYATDERGHRHG
jgi:urease accessory protein